MSDLFEILACELNKNNVSIETHRVASPNLLAIGENIVEEKIVLDFSKRDKVFENKISELKAKIAIKDTDYKTASELLCKYQQENEALKRRIQELDAIDTMRIDEERELKQRIAELESKEMENFSEIDTSNPLACAESLIEHMTHCEKFMIMPERDAQTFSVEELKEIADYLMVYYKHHKYRDAEDTISF